MKSYKELHRFEFSNWTSEKYYISIPDLNACVPVGNKFAPLYRFLVRSLYEIR